MESGARRRTGSEPSRPSGVVVTVACSKPALDGEVRVVGDETGPEVKKSLSRIEAHQGEDCDAVRSKVGRSGGHDDPQDRRAWAVRGIDVRGKFRQIHRRLVEQPCSELDFERTPRAGWSLDDHVDFESGL